MFSTGNQPHRLTDLRLGHEYLIKMQISQPSHNLGTVESHRPWLPSDFLAVKSHDMQVRRTVWGMWEMW